MTISRLKVVVLGIWMVLLALVPNAKCQGKWILASQYDRPVLALLEGPDTLYMSTSVFLGITSPRRFKSKEDENLYFKYRRYAADVYPYAYYACYLYREMQNDTKDMKGRDRKKHVKAISGDLSDQYTEILKNLSKTQGKILIEMVEKDLQVPFYSIIKDAKGGFKATYWNEFAKFYGYRLKDQYKTGQEPILDAVLNDFPISRLSSM
jgi:hypothetical protein